MANNLYDKLINSEIPFLVLSSFCVYNFVTYSTKNRKVRNSKNEFTNLSIIEIDVHKEGKFGNVLSLLKRQQKRIDLYLRGHRHQLASVQDEVLTAKLSHQGHTCSVHQISTRARC